MGQMFVTFVHCDFLWPHLLRLQTVTAGKSEVFFATTSTLVVTGYCRNSPMRKERLRAVRPSPTTKMAVQ